MMSEHASQTYEQGEVSGLDFNGTNDNTSLHPRMGQWLSHWMNTCRARPSKSYQKHGKTAHIGIQFTGHARLALEQVKSEELKPLCLDINQRHTSGCEGQSVPTSSNVDLMSPALQFGRADEVDWGKLRVTDKSTLRSNMESLDEEIACSDSWNITESCMKWKSATSPHFQNLDDFGSEHKNFPTVDINEKVETLVASMGNSYSDAILGNSPVTSNVFECFQPDHPHDVSRTSLAINGCKCQKKTIRDACMFSCGLSYKVSANSELSRMQDKLCCCSSSNKLISEGTRGNINSMSTSFGSAWTSVKERSTYVLRESPPNYSPFHFSVEEHGKNVKDDSINQLLLGHKRCHRTVCSDMQLRPSKVPKSSVSDASQHGPCRNLKSVENAEGFYKSCKRINSVLVAKEMGLDLCQIELITGASSVVTQHKKIAFSETVMMPTKQYYGEKVTTTLPFGNFTNDESRRGHGEIGTHLMEANNESSAKADAICFKPHQRLSSILGKTFSRPPRIIASASHAHDAPCKRAETGTSNKVEPLSTEWATSATNEDGADHILLQISPPGAELAKGAPLLLSPSAECCRANKCCSPSMELQMTPQSVPKIADISSHGRSQNSVSESETCSRWLKCLQGKPLPSNRLQLSKTMPLPGSSSPFLEAFDQPWVRSWRCNRRRMVAKVAFLPLKGEKLFASVQAMALMGKAMQNYKPCKFQREEAILIWTT